MIYTFLLIIFCLMLSWFIVRKESDYTILLFILCFASFVLGFPVLLGSVCPKREEITEEFKIEPIEESDSFVLGLNHSYNNRYRSFYFAYYFAYRETEGGRVLQKFPFERTIIIKENRKDCIIRCIYRKPVGKWKYIAFSEFARYEIYVPKKIIIKEFDLDI